MTADEKFRIIMDNDTTKYFEYIKGVLASESKMTDYTYHIPFNYDENKLKKMCEAEGIDMAYSSSYYIDGGYNPYMPTDKLVFSRKKVR